ncbi:hypothetical protein M0802_011993 [Mischocyttarus mexicanus]|nr:hypothetical protein M0802_011993 [Mischocyttarus mexicanus]
MDMDMAALDIRNQVHLIIVRSWWLVSGSHIRAVNASYSSRPRLNHERSRVVVIVCVYRHRCFTMITNLTPPHSVFFGCVYKYIVDDDDDDYDDDDDDDEIKYL